MKTIFILFLILTAAVGNAFETFQYQPWFTYGMEARFERDNSQNIVSRNMFPIAVGIGISPVIWYLEYGNFIENTGNASLSVRRKFENYFMGGSYLKPEWKFGEYFLPYFGAAIGQTREIIDTTLLGATSTDASQFYSAIDFHLGVLANYTTFMWFSVEGRLIFGEKTEPTPQVSILGRLGFWFR